MKIPFYLLGLLIRCGPQHGYSLKQIVEEQISDFAKIKLPTIYYHLQKLKEQGFISEQIDKDGNRPEKMVYSITDHGREHFDDLLVSSLKEDYSPEFLLDGVLFFIERADRDRLNLELNKKKDEMEKKLEMLKRHKKNSLGYLDGEAARCAEAIFDHHHCHLEAELTWLERTIKGLSQK